MGRPWYLRALPALGTFGLIFLWLSAAAGSIRYMVETLFGFAVGGDMDIKSHAHLWGAFEVVLSGYIFLLHLLALAFPIRSCWAVVITTCDISSGRRWCKAKREALKCRDQDDMIERDGNASIIHACILPAYKEDIDTLRDTLDVLASSGTAKTNISVWLAREEKDPQARSIAADLERSYASSFRSIQSTFHPAGLLGEAQGKSSNVSWAAKHATRTCVQEGLRDVILTVMDADTHLSPDYFVLVSNMHANSKKADADISMYVPPVIFDRNAHKVPVLVRLADLTWSAASLSGTYPGSQVCIPTSVYSVPLTLAEAVGGWDVGPDAIGEDLHMFLKCYFHTRGALIARPVRSAASQCNVDSDKTGIRGWIDGLQARWKQGFRHMWGALDFGYAVQRGFALWRDANDYNDDCASYRRISKSRMVLLYLRLFEAHCLPVQLPISMLATALFQAFIPKIITPTPMYISFILCNMLSGMAFILLLLYFFFYRRYHALCLSIRMDDSANSGLHGRADFSSGSTGVRYWIECSMFPIAGTLFAAVPALVAQMCHLFTEDLAYTVSLKPQKELTKRPGLAL